MRRFNPIGLFLGSIAFLAGIWIGRNVPRGAPERTRAIGPGVAHPDEVRLGRAIEARLLALEAQGESVLARLAELSSERHAIPSERESVRAEDPALEEDELARELRSIREELRALQARLPDPELDLARLRESKPQADWGTLGALLALHDADPDQARREVQLLSRSEVLRRYGTPDLTYLDPDLHWVYGRDKVADREAWHLQLVFAFQGDVVSAFWVERT